MLSPEKGGVSRRKGFSARKKNAVGAREGESEEMMGLGVWVSFVGARCRYSPCYFANPLTISPAEMLRMW